MRVWMVRGRRRAGGRGAGVTPVVRVHTAGAVGGSTAGVATHRSRAGTHGRVLTVSFEKQSESNAMWALSSRMPFSQPLVAGAGGTRSDVVVGPGSQLARNSSPHGAGREYIRSRARKTFTHDDLRAAMADIEDRDTDAFIDEIPAAYKSIDEVMANQADLVQPIEELKQVLCVKGS